MTTILFTFIAACLFTLVVTPYVKKMALSLGLVDMPSARKIHEIAVPRIGGVAIFFAFFFPFVFLYFFREQSEAAQMIFNDSRSSGFLVGATLIFLLGLWDDVSNLSFKTKFAGQIAVSLIAYFCGFKIAVVTSPFTTGVSLGFLALPVTVFWFVLVINAINLVDGLDGLAAGICLFVSLAMLFVCTSRNTIVAALAFASLAGTLIGFLRYNFNPASIFMGDSGSYFLGFALAALSVGGSMKGQVATAMLIPVIALGVPLIDTLWAPFRRFVLGQKMFQPDRSHIHHRLVKLGYTQQRAVLLIYGVTIFLGIGAMTLVHAQNDASALILFVLGVGVILITRYLGLPDFFSMHRISVWARDLTDEAGISHERRSFLNHQLNISRATDLDTLWQAVGESLDSLGFDYADFCYFGNRNEQGKELSPDLHLTWKRCHDSDRSLTEECVLKIELPVHQIDNGEFYNFGTLLLVKDMRHDIAGHYTLKRVEHLRRTMVAALVKICG